MLKGEMTGIEATQKIAEIIDIPIIYLTANYDNETLTEAKKTAPYGYLIKPYEDSGLKSAIEMAVFNHHNEKRLKDNENALKFSGEILKQTKG